MRVSLPTSQTEDKEMNHGVNPGERWTDVCDVAFIVALREELKAAGIFEIELAESIQNDLDLEISAHRFFDSRGQQLRVLTVLLDDQGPENAAIATTKFLQRVEPRLLFLVGISGRISTDLKLGDVVLATACDNSLYRAKRKSQSIMPGGKEWPLDALASRVAAAVAEMPAYLSYSEIDSPTQLALRQEGLIRETPTTANGPISTTPFLVDDPEFSNWLQTSRNRNILATDMESAAVVQAAHSCGVRNGRVLVIRGISDLADGTKATADSIGKGAIRRAAMRNAAELARHCISRILDFDADGLRVNLPGLDQNNESLSPYHETIDLLRSLARNIDENRKTEIVSCIEISEAQRKNSLLSRQLRDLAEAAYTQAIDRKENQHQALLQRIPRTACDYLIARWIMGSIPSSGTLPRAVELLSKVYPQRINRFCKAFLASTQDEAKFVDSLMEAYNFKPKGTAASVSQERAKAHICYLLGRVRHSQQRSRAAHALIEWRQKLVPSHVWPKFDASDPVQLARGFHSIESRERRLLLRTICISLVLLDQPGESETYVRACLRNKEFDSLNRGFHLEYYGDIDYDPSLSMSNTDPITGQWAKTFETLFGKLRTSYEKNQPYAMRDIELQTLLSLAQHRHSAFALEEDQRNVLADFLSEWSPERLTSISMLQTFCRMLKDALSHLQFRRRDLLKKLYELKKLPRSGWNDRRNSRKTPNPESVLSHTAGGLILINFCLPDRLGKEDRQKIGEDLSKAYSKNEITKIFLAHDFAEAYIGDLLPYERNDETKAEEQRVNSLIDLFSTWPGLYHFGMYRSWNDFENFSTINGRVAREIDALENLMQLRIEVDSPSVQIPDYDVWRDEIAQRIHTPMGRRILEMLLE